MISFKPPRACGAGGLLFTLCSLRQVSVGQAPGVVMGKVPLLHEAELVTSLQTQVHTPHGQAQAEIRVRPAQEMSLQTCFIVYLIQD